MFLQFPYMFDTHAHTCSCFYTLSCHAIRVCRSILGRLLEGMLSMFGILLEGILGYVWEVFGGYLEVFLGGV